MAEENQMKYEGFNKRRTGWTVNKEISVGDIGAFFMAFMAVVAAYFTLDKRLALVENAIIIQQKVDAAQDLERRAYVAELKEGQNRLEAKIDVLITKIGTRYKGSGYNDY